MFWNRKTKMALQIAEDARKRAEANLEIRNWFIANDRHFQLVPEKVVFCRDGPQSLEIRFYSRAVEQGQLITYAFVRDHITDEAVSGLWLSIGTFSMQLEYKSDQFTIPSLGVLMISAKEPAFEKASA